MKLVEVNPEQGIGVYPNEKQYDLLDGDVLVASFCHWSCFWRCVIRLNDDAKNIDIDSSNEKDALEEFLTIVYDYLKDEGSYLYNLSVALKDQFQALADIE